MIQIRIHGTGGQGAVVAGKLLADAAAKNGYKSQCFSSYGGERRGGSVESYVRISNKEIVIHSKLYEPDYIVLMDEKLAKNPQTISGLKEEGGVLVNSSKLPDYFSSLGNYRIVTIDGDAIARKQGLKLASGMPIINTVILGAVVAMIPMIRFDYLSEAIREGKIPLAEKNVEAAKEAYHRVKLQLTGTGVPEVKEAPEISVTQVPVFRTKMSPCEAGTTYCIVGETIRTIISLIQRNQFEEAFENIKLENPFPGICGRVCFHPCETHCNRNEYDEGIAINALERAVFDHADMNKVSKPARKEKTGKNVAIIGSGPAGLTSAYFLALLGHDVTIFEALSVLGGIPRAWIPEYRLPKDVVDREVGQIIELGINARTNTEVGKDISFEDIMNQYDACLITTGKHKSMRLDIPGEDSEGVISGLDFLRRVIFGEKVDLGPKVAVIGGGNAGIDVARTAKRLGAREVTIIERLSSQEVLAYREEVEEAQAEGIKIFYLTIPIRIDRKGKGVSRLNCVKVVLKERGSDGQWRFQKVEGTNFTMEANTIIVAAGETLDISFLPPTVKMNGSLIEVDSFGKTSVKGLYAGGDATLISRSVAEAIASGKRSAVGIDIWLTGTDEKIFGCLQKGERGAISMGKYLDKNYVAQDSTLVSFKDLNIAYFNKVFRAQVTKLPTEARFLNFNEIISGLSKNKAIEEAERCFQCGQCTLCENCYIFCPDVAISFGMNGSSLIVAHEFCKECGICIQECPRGAMGWEVRTR